MNRCKAQGWSPEKAIQEARAKERQPLIDRIVAKWEEQAKEIEQSWLVSPTIPWEELQNTIKHIQETHNIIGELEVAIIFNNYTANLVIRGKRLETDEVVNLAGSFIIPSDLEPGQYDITLGITNLLSVETGLPEHRRFAYTEQNSCYISKAED